jgi:hypothetical protein
MARLTAAAVAGIALGTMLGGCSDIYYDRRETIALSAGDAVAANEVEQMVDPWPRHSGNKNIAFNGERMQRAVECYRANRVNPPTDPLSTSTNSSQNSSTSTTNVNPTPAAVTTCQGQMSSGSTQSTGAAIAGAAIAGAAIAGAALAGGSRASATAAQ